MSQKGIEDQRRNEEEVLLLKEKNKELKQQLDGTEREDQSRLGDHTYNKEKTTTTQTQTHQSSRADPHDKDPKGHPSTDEIMEAQLPYKWKGFSINSMMAPQILTSTLTFTRRR